MIPLASIRASLLRSRLPISIALAVAVLAILGGHWAVYGRSVTITSGDDPPASAFVTGTLQINSFSSTATAYLHNTSDWTIDHVVLFIISGQKKKCRKEDTDCGADGYLPIRSWLDAEDFGPYRCGRKLSAEPASTFTCSFVVTFKHGPAYTYSWNISEVSGRRKDPLGFY
jgi:hypothetical protein